MMLLTKIRLFLEKEGIEDDGNSLLLSYDRIMELLDSFTEEILYDLSKMVEQAFVD